MSVLNTKECEFCKTLIFKKVKQSKTQWEDARFCSRSCNSKGSARPFLERFWAKVPKGLSDDVCWDWEGTKGPDGYGRLHEQNSTKIIKAHRAALIVAGVDLPAGMVVMHTCDNPPCVNPNHLRVGTQRENMQDAGRKGRMSCKGTYGERNGQAKLKENQVRTIRQKVKDGETYIQLGKEYGVDPSTIGLIARNIKWKHIGA